MVIRVDGKGCGKYQKGIGLLLICFVLLFLWTSPASACSCNTPTVELGLQQANQVFSGRVLAVELRTREPDADGLRQIDSHVLFEVNEWWKGQTPSQIEITTSGGGGPSCGLEFVTGQQYLVYAIKDLKTDMLVSTLCSRTKWLSTAHEDLAYLSKGAKPTEVVHLESEFPMRQKSRSNYWWAGGVAIGALLLLLILRQINRQRLK